MWDAVRSEWIRIWRPSFLVGVALMAGFAALISVFIFTSAEDANGLGGGLGGGQQPPGPGSFVTVAEIAEPGGFLTALTTVSNLAGIILLVLWAIAAANDYSTGIIRILVQAQPRRVTLLAGKMIALTGFTLLATAVTTMVVALVARPLANLEGIETDAWQTDFGQHLASGYLNFTVSALVWGLIGLLIAVLTRSSALAIGIGIGYLLVVEGLIGIVVPDARAYLPGGTLNAVVAGGTSQLAWLAALFLSIAYGIVATGLSFATFHRRDIVS